jgi:hypothetical protein
MSPRSDYGDIALSGRGSSVEKKRQRASRACDSCKAYVISRQLTIPELCLIIVQEEEPLLRYSAMWTLLIDGTRMPIHCTIYQRHPKDTSCRRFQLDKITPES